MTGHVNGAVRTTLRLEGLSIFLLALAFYHSQGLEWSTFLIWVLLPDIALLAFAAGPKIGAIAYNLTHSLIGPAALLGVTAFLPQPEWVCASLIWFAHIGFDRALGYGLKYSDAFTSTHLGRIGKRNKSANT